MRSVRHDPTCRATTRGWLPQVVSGGSSDPRALFDDRLRELLIHRIEGKHSVPQCNTESRETPRQTT